MAVTFNTTTRYNSETHLAVPEVETIIPAGTVLSVTNYTYHVPSDRAAVGRRVHYFLGGRVSTLNIFGGHSMDGYYEITVDASPETRALAERWTRWSDWFISIVCGLSKIVRYSKVLSGPARMTTDDVLTCPANRVAWGSTVAMLILTISK